jgi:hypothetical protein
LAVEVRGKSLSVLKIGALTLETKGAMKNGTMRKKCPAFLT